LLHAKTYSRNLEITQRTFANVTRKPEKHKFLTILKNKKWQNFAENTKDTRERISLRVLVA
jgi:hypothetical protein